MKIYFLMYHVRPLPDSENAGNIAGAYVSCWIEAISVTKADRIARDEIRLAKWNVLERDDAYEIKKNITQIIRQDWNFINRH